MPSGQYHELRYENLITGPQGQLRRICDFLGEDFSPDMMVQYKLARKQIRPGSHFFDNVRNPVNTNSLGRGRRGLPESDRRLIQRVAGTLMCELGYVPDNLGGNGFC